MSRGLRSVDDFKAAVARQSSIPPQYIIALTPQGRPVKLSTLPAEASHHRFPQGCSYFVN